jgi:outer membrane protein OmpA-like peptidoglycan-associated protein
MLKKVLGLCLIGAMAQGAYAYDLSGKFGVGGSANYAIPVFGNPFNDVNDADWGWGAHMRYHFNPHFNLEAGFARSNFDNTDIRFDSYNVLAVWRLAGDANVTPIAGLGLGATRIINFEPRNVKLSGLARLGMEWGLAENISFHALADYQYVSDLLGEMPAKRAHVVTPQVGLTFYFGSMGSSVAVVEEPAKEEVIVKEVRTAYVDPSQMDTDNDGVSDADDKCPSTMAGAKVNAIGCAVTEKASMKIEVEFDTGKSSIAREYDSHLNQVAAFLKKYPEVKVNIEGYTDNTGSRATNVRLSDQRAKSVMQALVSRGVAKNRLSAKGFGPENPIADNSTPVGRQQNRRVEAVLTTDSDSSNL